MPLYNVLALLGVSSIFGMLWVYLFKKVGDSRRESEATKKGIQALLRAQMISEFNKAKEKGYAPIYAKDNFENMWQNYHALGVNGVMDGVHERYMKLPNRKEDRIRDEEYKLEDQN